MINDKFKKILKFLKIDMIFIVSSHFLPSLILSAKKNQYILSNINTKHFIFYYNVFYYVKSFIIHSLNNN